MVGQSKIMDARGTADSAAQISEIFCIGILEAARHAHHIGHTLTHGHAHTLSSNRSDKEDRRICAMDRYALREQFL